ncbi:hypothetical protein [Roseomonas haemaphysalidis]|uniref:EF-hand domain-containing protein n=1 Tax=Roseomonas haemaphysalidis TaxID=2768162 RepID=A0ABS3KTS9_9PROT|nr:hypothetical protein [Roseomonas haemaphysalidis]MBO1080874.1 hypothetical protein [Roseomonas haemaphysalidis]
MNMYLPDNISIEHGPDRPLTRAERALFDDYDAANSRNITRDSLEDAHAAVLRALDDAVRDGDGVGAQAALDAMRAAAALLAGAVA